MALENEKYVLDLCDEVLGQPACRQHRFDGLLGDPSPKTGRQVKLPVDAYWPDLKLIVEFYERQHSESVKHFDKPDVMTVSGVHRGIQRAIYDQRRFDYAKEHGLTVVAIEMKEFTVVKKKIVPNHTSDIKIVKKHLAAFLK